MSKFLYYLIDSGFRYLMLFIAFWMLIRFIEWIAKVFIPATKELIRDLRELREQQRSSKH